MEASTLFKGKSITVDDLVREAREMIQEKLTLEMAAIRHPEFTKSYPIVSQYICELGMWSEKAFRSFIETAVEAKSDQDLKESYKNFIYDMYMDIYGVKSMAKNASLTFSDIWDTEIKKIAS